MHQPTYLTEEGYRILTESGLRRYIDGYKEMFVDLIEHSHTDPQSIVVTERASIEFFENVELDPDFKEDLKEYSKESKQSTGTLKRIGGIYLRDLVLEHVGEPERPRELVRVG